MMCWALEHRYMMWEHCGPFDPSQHVHHRNGNRQDNRLENLELLDAHEHASEHAAGVKIDRARTAAERRALRQSGPTS